ncbi:hypothetical protein MSAR_32790 [Mycolicibacterium sarraceniae]|uniref:Uncharacterized protein n=1 Tax=Mycolicibacterium sarraceniae TaxID=1534348 RepID=A0A7I7STW3_9MYCO|nr:hypothetical protein MSAR_32790 [Mycolicibacterium sarraceniae]
MMMPPLGWAAVPLLKKTLSSDWRPPPTANCSDFGVLVTATVGVAVGDGLATSALVSVVGATTLVGLVCADTALAGELDLTVCLAPTVNPRVAILLWEGVFAGRAGPACPVDFDDVRSGDGPLEEADSLFPVDAPVSAEAAGAVEAIAAPRLSAIAEAPTHVSTRRCPEASDFGAAMPPNRAGSIRSVSAASVVVR